MAGGKSLVKNGDEILLVGDISRAALDANAVGKLPWRVCAGIGEAVELAANKPFAAIVAVMSSFAGNVEAGLKALRRANSRARIYLLVQMYEEPVALELVHAGHNGTRLIDDYFICPVRLGQLCGPILESRVKDKPLSPVVSGKDVIRPEGREQLYGNGRDDKSKDEVIAELSRLAIEDDLTGAKNGRYVREFCRQIIELAKQQDLNVTLLLYDIDNFKRYNDTYGHSVGDMILKQAVELMKSCCRSHDVVGRIGGDEFAVVFWDRPSEQVEAERKKDSSAEGLKAQERRLSQGNHPREAMFIAERFRKELGSTRLPLLGPAGKGVLTISGGLASFPRDGGTAEELFVQADAALLEAKRSGKNRIYLVGEPQNNDIRK